MQDPSKATHASGVRAVPGRVSVITAVYNAAPNLSKCIESMLSQDYSDVEHVLVDGGSTDGSLEILKSYGDRIVWNSEKDNGIYDAWNKGLRMATGEWIAFVGADDLYLPGAISTYMEAVKNDNSVQYVSSLVRLSYPWGGTRIIGKPWSWPAFQIYMTTAHVGSMHRATLFERYGMYDPTYRMVGDYELLLRPRDSLKTRFLPTVTAVMEAGGATDSFSALHEAAKAKMRTGARNPSTARLELWSAQLKLVLRKSLTKLHLSGTR